MAELSLWFFIHVCVNKRRLLLAKLVDKGQQLSVGAANRMAKLKRQKIAERIL